MRIFVGVMLFFTSLPVLAQVPGGLPAQFIQFFKTYQLSNPAAAGRDSSFEITTGNRSLLGAFSGVRTSYGYTQFQLGHASANKVRSMMGLNFINDREGNYISKNRATMLYSVHIPLSARAALNAGASAGFLNYSYKASDIDGGGSAFAPDLGLGLWLQTTKFNLGFSANQLIPARLKPASETYILARYYTLNIDRNFLLSRHLSLKPACAVRVIDKKNYTGEAALLALIQQNLLAGVTYKYKKGGSISVGVENIHFGQNIFKLLCSFYTPLTGFDYYNPQSLEISLSYIHQRKEGEKVEEE